MSDWLGADWWFVSLRLVQTVLSRVAFYAPTSSLDSLRAVLGVAQLRQLHLRTLDVSTAFMYAPVEAESCDLVMLPSNLTT